MSRNTTHDQRLRKLAQLSFVLLGCLALSAYFIHHAFNGRYGLEAQTRLIERTAELSREIRSLETVRVRLQRHVSLLDRSPPARDFVEEIARRDLGYSYPADVIIRLR